MTDTIIQKFTTYYKKSLFEAFNCARQTLASEITPEHLLWGIFNQPTGVANEYLNQKKLTLEDIAKIITIPRVDSNTTTPMLSELSQIIITHSARLAQQLHHNFIGLDHLFLATLEKAPLVTKKFLDKIKTTPEETLETLKHAMQSITKFCEFSTAFNRNTPLFDEFTMNNSPRTHQSALTTYGVELTDAKYQEKINPLIGRENEIARLTEILCRRNKNNPLLIGEPGVGKTAIVEGLAQKILSGDMPAELHNKKIYNIDLGAIVAGTTFRGEFENRIKQIIDETVANPNIILFIDEMHNIVGAGSASGSLDAANILKPHLARGSVRLIGATTPAEFKKHIENDATLERRFQTINVPEPSREETKKILEQIKSHYQDFHHVAITPEAIEETLELSSRYLAHRFFPDKALDIIDEAASRFKINDKSTLNKAIKLIKHQEVNLAKIETSLAFAVAHEKMQEALELLNLKKEVNDNLAELEGHRKTLQTQVTGELTVEDIRETVAKITNIPHQKITEDHRVQLLSLEKILSEKIIAQDEAIKTLADTIRRASTRIHNPTKPLGTFLFLGPSGVGKTLTAKILAETIFAGTNSLIRVDMSEFSQSFNASKLIGAPAGYVGYKESNKFSDLVKQNPHSVVLFDEVEKAHPEIFNLLLPVMDEGYLTDAGGRKIDFKNTIIILTSNLGSEHLEKSQLLGFGETDQHNFNWENYKTLAEKSVKEKFTPEFLNRIDKIIYFNPLSTEHLEKIVELELDQLNDRLSNHKITLEPNDATIKFLSKENYSPAYGARTLKKNIENFIENELAKIILGRKNTTNNKKIKITASDGKIILK